MGRNRKNTVFDSIIGIIIFMAIINALSGMFGFAFSFFSVAYDVINVIAELLFGLIPIAFPIVFFIFVFKLIKDSIKANKPYEIDQYANGMKPKNRQKAQTVSNLLPRIPVGRYQATPCGGNHNSHQGYKTEQGQGKKQAEACPVTQKQLPLPRT